MTRDQTAFFLKSAGCFQLSWKDTALLQLCEDTETLLWLKSKSQGRKRVLLQTAPLKAGRGPVSASCSETEG